MSGSLWNVFSIAPLLSMFAVLARLIAGIVVSMAVYRNAQTRQAQEFGIPPVVWAILAFAEPAIGLFVYWYIHRDVPSVEAPSHLN